MVEIRVRTVVGFRVPHRRERPLTRPESTDERGVDRTVLEHHALQCITPLLHQLSNFYFEVGIVRTHEMFVSEMVEEVISAMATTIRCTIRLVQPRVGTANK